MIKPSPPKLNALIKIHKPNTPIRPLINFKTAPTYAIAKYMNNILNEKIKLQIDYSIKNNIELIEKIKTINIPNRAKLISFDITNMYANIPINEAIIIIENLLKFNNINHNEINEITKIIKTITQQNYFTHNNKIYQQIDGLAMGNPLSGTIANIYMNHIENKYIMNERNKFKNNIIYWHRYVDDILVLFNGTQRQLDGMHVYLNKINAKLKFTLEIENEKQINFLDLNIKNVNNIHTFSIHRKETQTSHTIHNTSDHPHQHKKSAYHHLINRLNNVPMTLNDYMREYNTIMQIARENGFSSNMIKNMNEKYKRKKELSNMTTLQKVKDFENKKYVTMTYNKNLNNHINKVFKQHGYNIAYKTTNKITNKMQDKNEYNCGVYKLECNDCPSFYIGQTGRSFEKRFREHVNEINKKDIKSKYASHLTESKHTYTNMNHNMKIIKRLNKGRMLDRYEEIEIYRNKNNTNILNDKMPKNEIYDKIIKYMNNT